MTQITQEQLTQAKSKHEPWLHSLPGVTGTGIGIGRGGNLCIKVFTNSLPDSTKQDIGARLKDVPFEFEETGEFRAL